MTKVVPYGRGTELGTACGGDTEAKNGRKSCQENGDTVLRTGESLESIPEGEGDVKVFHAELCQYHL